MVRDYAVTDVLTAHGTRLGPICSPAAPRLLSGDFQQRDAETVVDFAVRLAPSLDRTTLAIQGPPARARPTSARR